MNFRVVFTLMLAALLPGVVLDAQFAFPSRTDDRSVVRTRVTGEVIRSVVRDVAPIVMTQPDDDPCRERGWDDDVYRVCEVRDYTLPAGPLNVEAGRNGGIRVEAWDRNEVQIRAIVTASARREEDARQLVSGVEVMAGSGRVSARGPSGGGRDWWSVSYRLSVPRQSDLELQATNGGISIAGVHGTIRFDTTNGGVNLRDLGGDVRGETRNGGVTVTLAGDRWEGAGLDVQTSNGGVSVGIPDNYNAELSTRTVNGRFRSDIPMTIQGELSPRRGIDTTLGSGGAPISVRTRNGGLRITRR